MTRFINRADALHTLKKLAYETALNQNYPHFSLAFEDLAKNRLQTWVNLIPTADVPERNDVKWIPVTEKLPEDGEEVLVTVEGWVLDTLIERAVDLASCNKYDGYIGCFDTCNDWIEYGDWKVTAWMPLPEPYRKETEDE